MSKGYIIFSRRLWLNLFLIGLVLALILLGSLWWLKVYTRHGNFVEVPNLLGITTNKLDDVLNRTSLTFEITDSVYSDDYPRGAVILQTPLPKSKVKEGRTIFLTVNSTLPEMVLMPDLAGKSRRIAIPMLQISGLVLENVKYEPDESCTDCVIGQLYKGRTIQPGEKVRKGEKITLVLGQQSNEVVIVPRLLGLSYEESIDRLTAYRLNPGVVLSCHGCYTADDSTAARVINQIPAHGTKATLGAYVDLYLTTDTVMGDTFVIPVDTNSYGFD